MVIAYLNTNNKDLVILVPGNEHDGLIKVVKAPANIRFDLTNTLDMATMREARAIAKRHGLKIVNANRISISHTA